MRLDAQDSIELLLVQNSFDGIGNDHAASIVFIIYSKKILSTHFAYLLLIIFLVPNINWNILSDINHTIHYL